MRVYLGGLDTTMCWKIVEVGNHVSAHDYELSTERRSDVSISYDDVTVITVSAR